MSKFVSQSRSVGVELKASYFNMAVKHLEEIEKAKSQINMFDLMTNTTERNRSLSQAMKQIST